LLALETACFALFAALETALLANPEPQPLRPTTSPASTSTRIHRREVDAIAIIAPYRRASGGRAQPSAHVEHRRGLHHNLSPRESQASSAQTRWRSWSADRDGARWHVPHLTKLSQQTDPVPPVRLRGRGRRADA
jgi:hypothetical protein